MTPHEKYLLGVFVCVPMMFVLAHLLATFEEW